MAAYVCQHPLPSELIGKYVSYAQAFCHPELSTEAKLMLREFYLDLRQQAAASPCVPVTVSLTRPLLLSLLVVIM
jgi:DNA replicative helicase MCM subunit Mcm2 (Cdc46/Mcm family)